jgi:hypothetical protein
VYVSIDEQAQGTALADQMKSKIVESVDQSGRIQLAQLSLALYEKDQGLVTKSDRVEYMLVGQDTLNRTYVPATTLLTGLLAGSQMLSSMIPSALKEYLTSKEVVLASGQILRILLIKPMPIASKALADYLLSLKATSISA